MEELQFVNVLCSGIVTGTYTFELMVVVPALSTVPSEESARVHRLLFRNLPNRYMPWLGIAAAVAGILLLFQDEVTGTARVLYIVGLVAWSGTFILLAGFSRPIDQTISRWVETSFPVDLYPQKRASWNRLMMIRGPLGILAFGCFVLAALESA